MLQVGQYHVSRKNHEPAQNIADKKVLKSCIVSLVA